MLRKLNYITAGESHGKYITATLEGIPADLKISIDEINHELWRRQQGYGRSERMKIERDEIEIISGLKNGVTTGAPISFLIKNKGILPEEKLTRPRPGHADLPGVLKYLVDDISYISERSSARETASRVACGAICKQFLKNFNINFFSFVKEIMGISLTEPFDIEKEYEKIEKSPLRCPDKEIEKKMAEKIDQAKNSGDTVGGIFEVIIKGVPIGLGSHTQWYLKLDARLAYQILSIQGVKGVEFGLGFNYSKYFGSQVHDQIFYDKKNFFYRKTNNAGGIEGGISNGQDIIISVVMKPISTLKKPLMTVDIKTKKPSPAISPRADVTAVPSCAVICENVCAIVIADAFLEKFSGDNMKEVKANYKNYLKLLRELKK